MNDDSVDRIDYYKVVSGEYILMDRVPVAPHKHIYTSELGEQQGSLGTLACTCGKLLLYQKPVEVEQ
jgi:hypothetical protein